MDCLCQSRNCPLVPRKGDFFVYNENVHGGFMNIKFNEDQLERFNQALERAMDCPFIQEDDDCFQGLSDLQEIINVCI